MAIVFEDRAIGGVTKSVFEVEAAGVDTAAKIILEEALTSIDLEYLALVDANVEGEVTFTQALATTRLPNGVLASTLYEKLIWDQDELAAVYASRAPADLTEVSARVTVVEGEITTVKGDITALDGRVTALETAGP